MEIAVDVGLEGPVPLFLGQVFDAGLVLLKGGIVDQDVELSERFDGPFDQFAAEVRIAHVAGHEHGFVPLGLDRLLGLFRVGLLFREVGQDDVGALAGEQHGHRAADPRVTAGDDGDEVFELVGRRDIPERDIPAVAADAIRGPASRCVVPGTGELVGERE